MTRIPSMHISTCAPGSSGSHPSSRARLVRHALALVSVLLAWTPAGRAATEQVETLDARDLAGKVVSLSAETLTLRTEADGVQTLPRKDVSLIRLGHAEDLLRFQDQAILRTVRGDQLAVRSLSLADGTITAVNDTLGEIRLPLQSARLILPARLGFTPAEILAGCRERKYHAETKDLLVVLNEDKWQSAPGVLRAIDPEKVTFRYRDKDRTITRDRLLAIWLAELARESVPPIGVLTLTDGSSLYFDSVSLTAETVSFSSAVLARDIPAEEAVAAELWTVPREAVASVRYLSDRVVPLSELAPTAVEQHGFFDVTFPYRVNAAVSGEPLRLNGRVYETGLGLHSFCELTYTLDGAYSILVADVGIDDLVRPGGNAMLELLGDGKPLRDPLPVRGDQAPLTLRLDITGVKTLVIRVGFGDDDLDVADHVNLAGARLVK